ncbi:MAG: hypothetical protein EB078_10145 [Proteobacteria bacterium]|nr:hypothetical protein [Pseudomonadota bacterium]NDD05256.1 hypothetical protein [Pseudomonadota bacterium]NDG28370.1 hypothetical protein [Pseudomonadota bacterium]
MRVKAEDLKMLMDYLEKEIVDTVDIDIGSDKFSIGFKFVDEENRECNIIIYQDIRDMKPDLIKKMALNTRIKK